MGVFTGDEEPTEEELSRWIRFMGFLAAWFTWSAVTNPSNADFFKVWDLSRIIICGFFFLFWWGIFSFASIYISAAIWTTKKLNKFR